MELNTKLMVVETSFFKPTASVWVGAGTVGDVITAVGIETAWSSEKPIDFLMKAFGKERCEFKDADGDFDADLVDAWEMSQSIESRVQAALDCAASDGHKIQVFWSREAAEDAVAPKGMTRDEYLAKIDVIFG